MHFCIKLNKLSFGKNWQLTHDFNLLRTSVTLFKNNRGSGFDIIILVSGAKRIGEEILFNTRGKSLM
jgi:hypothetical protein